MKATQFLLFACGQVGVMAMARYFFQWVLHFGDKSGAVGLTAASVGAVCLAFRVLDAVVDPVAGALSDGWVKRGRERRELLWFSFLLPPVGLALIFAPSADYSEVANWALLGAGMLIFFLGYTFYAIPYWSLVDDYSRTPNGYDDARRTKLSNLLGAGLLVATGIGFVASPSLVVRYGHWVAALCFAVPCTGLMALPFFAQPRDLPRPQLGGKEESPFAAFRVAFGDRRFAAVVALFAGGQMSFTIMTAAAPYVAEDLLHGTLGDVPLLLGPFLGTALASFALVPRLVRKLGWERTTLVATLMLGVVYAGTGALGFSVVGTPVHTAMVVFALGGPMAAVLLGLENEAIIACAAASGGEMTAVYLGVYNFVVKALNGVALFLTGVLSTQTATFGSLAIRCMGFLAGALLVLGVVAYVSLRPGSRSSVSPSA